MDCLLYRQTNRFRRCHRPLTFTRALSIDGPDKIGPLSSISRVPIVVPENDLRAGLGSGVAQHGLELAGSWIGALQPRANTGTRVLVPVEGLKRHLRPFSVGCSDGVDVAGRRSSIAGGSAGTDRVVVRTEDVRETKRAVSVVRRARVPSSSVGATCAAFSARTTKSVVRVKAGRSNPRNCPA